MSKISFFCGVLFSATTAFSAVSYALSYEDSLQKGESLFHQATQYREVNEKFLTELKEQAQEMISKYQGLDSQEAKCKVKLGKSIESEIDLFDDIILEDTKKYLKPNMEEIRRTVNFLVGLRDKGVLQDIIEEYGGAELIKSKEKSISHSLWSLGQMQYSRVLEGFNSSVKEKEQKYGCLFER